MLHGAVGCAGPAQRSMTRMIVLDHVLFLLLARQPRMGRDSIAQGASALGNDGKYHPSPEGARFQCPQTHRVTRESRPGGALGFLWAPKPRADAPWAIESRPLGAQ